MDITARVLGFVLTVLGAVMVTQCFYDMENGNAVVVFFGTAALIFGFFLVAVVE